MTKTTMKVELERDGLSLWAPHPTEAGMSRRVRNLSAREVKSLLDDELKNANLEPEWVAVSATLKSKEDLAGNPLPNHHSVAVWLSEGGNEGHHVTIALVLADGKAETPLLHYVVVTKTLAGLEEARAIRNIAENLFVV